MSYSAPGKCPICGNRFLVTKLSCNFCGTKLEGEFSPCKFCQLSPEHREFMEIFIKCRGNIKDVERELGISYPTVRNRLDSLAAALGYSKPERSGEEKKRERIQQVLDALEGGKITAAEAEKQLKN
ncbi:MAG: DUF2089 domain-containing protein [Firmicutes bacterium]|nr:DUF2089 domain-containing protein [Bacillota bacterium]